MSSALELEPVWSPEDDEIWDPSTLATPEPDVDVTGVWSVGDESWSDAPCGLHMFRAPLATCPVCPALQRAQRNHSVGKRGRGRARGRVDEMRCAL